MLSSTPSLDGGRARDDSLDLRLSASVARYCRPRRPSLPSAGCDWPRRARWQQRRREGAGSREECTINFRPHHCIGPHPGVPNSACVIPSRRTFSTSVLSTIGHAFEPPIHTTSPQGRHASRGEWRGAERVAGGGALGYVPSRAGRDPFTKRKGQTPRTSTLARR